MATMRDIKRRQESIGSTSQITKAMKLVATVKLQKARQKAENAKPYMDAMYRTTNSIIRRTKNIWHPYLVPSDAKQKAVIVITSNRGLAGGYNSNVVKLITRNEVFSPEETDIYALGTKGRDDLAARGYSIIEDYSEVMNEPLYQDAREIGKAVLKSYEEEKIGEIYLTYTVFQNTVKQVPTLLKLLPANSLVDSLQDPGVVLDEDKSGPMNFEPSAETALDYIIPKYIYSLIYGGMLEAIASENGARMSAMDAATSNAEELMDELELKYNRARQGSITQELTEIIAGAEGVNS